jgi:hypothetical protein
MLNKDKKKQIINEIIKRIDIAKRYYNLHKDSIDISNSIFKNDENFLVVGFDDPMINLNNYIRNFIINGLELIFEIEFYKNGDSSLGGQINIKIYPKPEGKIHIKIQDNNAICALNPNKIINIDKLKRDVQKANSDLIEEIKNEIQSTRYSSIHIL